MEIRLSHATHSSQEGSANRCLGDMGWEGCGMSCPAPAAPVADFLTDGGADSDSGISAVTSMLPAPSIKTYSVLMADM